jgi:hypothetical protein
VIKSASYDQTEILSSVLLLIKQDRFDADITYGNGSFYKNIPQPDLKFDIDPQVDGVVKASSTNLPVDDSSLSSVVFDPPFLTYIKQAREHDSVMAKRYGGYWRYDELEDHYKQTLKEAHRILCKKGVLVFKCQDIIHNHRMHPTHINVCKWADGMFRLKDLFILAAKSRMSLPEKEGEAKRVQKHARIHHSYFMILEKEG